MTELSPDTLAPDFTLQDVTGEGVRLSDFRGKFVVLAALRGFT
jgi:peroxiredoxin